MNEHDHFSSVLDVEAIEEPLDSHFDEGHLGMAADSDEAQAHEPPAPRKKPIPKALLLIGGMVAFVVLGAGYQHFFGAHPQNVASSGMTGSGSGGPDAGDTPLPAGTAITQQTQNGMPTHDPVAPPLPSQMQGQASEPIGPLPSQQSSRDLFANAAMPASMGAASESPGGVPSDVASRSGAIGAAPTAPSPSPSPTFGNAAVPGSASLIQTSVEHGAPPGGLATGPTASAVAESSVAMNAAPAPDPRDVEIAKLQAEVDALQRRDGVTGAGPAPVRAPVHRTAKHLSHGSRVAKERSRSGASTNLIAGAHTSTDSSTADTSNGTPAAVADTTPSAGASGSAKPASAKSVARHAGKRHYTRHAQHGKHPEAEVLAGYSIKQVIPGQGWIEDEQSGRQQVVAVGDVIGTAKVVRIDPDNYRIVTTAGVIQ